MKMWMTLAGVLGALGVLLGAFGAHALKNRLTTEAMGWWQTAVQYHFYHTLALMGVALLILHFGQARVLTIAAVAFLVGILLFSGSLYVMALTGTRWLGAVTPFGGLAAIIGWLLIAFFAFTR